MKWSCYQKDKNQITLNHATLQNLALSIFNVFIKVLLNIESFLESNSQLMIALCETNLDDSIDSGNYSYAWCCSLCEERTSFCMGVISRKTCRSLRFLIPLLHSVSSLFLFFLSPSLSLSTGFDATLSNIDDLIFI